MSWSAFGPGYRKLWAASAVSNLGDGVTLMARPLIARGFGLAAPFWSAAALMTLGTVAFLPVVNNRSVAKARGEAV